jgi:hypothetical protein
MESEVRDDSTQPARLGVNFETGLRGLFDARFLRFRFARVVG